jgi:hypothetical protein
VTISWGVVSTGARWPSRLGLVFGAAAFAAAPSLAVISLIHDLIPVHPPRWTSQALSVIVFAALIWTVGRAAMSTVRQHTHPYQGSVLALGSLSVTVLAAWAPLRLLRPDASSASRLAWILGEEDNAQVVGIAREVIIHGPAGQGLADQYGTGFVVSAITLLRATGSQLLDLDPRLAAISVFTMSVGVAVVVLGCSLLNVLLLFPGAAREPRLLELPFVLLTSASLTAIAIGISLVVPMRTGFLTFVWSLAWLALGASILLVKPRGTLDRIALTVHAFACALLVIRSWPFVLAGVAVTLALSARWIPRPRLDLGALATRHLVGSVAVGGAAITAAVLSLRGSALEEVLAYGREALTLVASEIAFDRVALSVVLIATTVLLVSARHSGRAAGLVLGGTVSAIGASWLALNGLAQAVTGGELNYAGWKLLYAFVAIGSLLALPAATRLLADRSPVHRVLAAGAVTAVLFLSSTALEVREWSSRTAPSEPPHALAVVEAIESTSLDIAIRCRPQPGTPVTESSRMAAYFCVRWVEDAFNEDRRGGSRFDYFFATDVTFDPIIEKATEEGLYGVLTRVLPLGPGWYSWDGIS